MSSALTWLEPLRSSVPELETLAWRDLARLAGISGANVRERADSEVGGMVAVAAGATPRVGVQLPTT